MVTFWRKKRKELRSLEYDWNYVGGAAFISGKTSEVFETSEVF